MLRVTGYGLRVTGYTGYVLGVRVTGYGFAVEPYVPDGFGQSVQNII